MQTIILFFLLLIITCLTRAQEIYVDDIIEKYKQLHLGPKKDAVLVLGPIGSGKTALALLLTGAELESKKKDDIFIITDKNNKIADNSLSDQLIPKTIVPDLMIDYDEQITYYDCPGFSESRELNADMKATLTFEKLLNFAESLKFIFTITYDSMKSDSKGII